YRERRSSISWFMRLLDEHIARRANKEDNCTGRFCVGRFKSQALLDEAALAACMAYVAFHPMRAKMANNPEESAHTIDQNRLTCAAEGK
ncbi:transposase, partial [Pseudoalteromonas sp. S3785]